MSVGMVADTVAKKKSRPAKSKTSDRKPMVVQIRGSEEWKAWIEGLAGREQDTVAKFFERLAKKFAKETGYPDPPNR